MTKQKAIDKLNIARDKIIDIVDAGYGCDATARALDILYGLINDIENKE